MRKTEEWMAFIAIGLLATSMGCISPSKTHVTSDVRFLNHVGKSARAYYVAGRTPEGQTLTADDQQALIDEVDSKADEVNATAALVGVSETARVK